MSIDITDSRPKDFRNIKGQKIIIKTLLNALENKKLPPKMSFIGPTGVGKTTTALCLARALFCTNYNFEKMVTCKKCDGCLGKTNITHHNCAQITVDKKFLSQLEQRMTYSMPILFGAYFRVEIFEEFHCWSKKDQEKLYLVLEKKSSNCLLIFTTTEKDKISKPLKRRLSQYTFSSLSINELLRLIKIEMKRDNLNLNERDTLILAKFSGGDARRVVTLLPQFANARAQFPEKDALSLLGHF